MKKTVLVVDDSKFNLAVARDVLADTYDVQLADSGKKALEFLEEKEPSLILLDIQMPEMSGYDVMEVIHKHERWRKIPVIFLTADRGEGTEEKCFDLGAVDYIGKPFIPQVMKRRVARTIELESYRKSLEEMVAKQLTQITQMQHEIIMTMANLIESRDGTTGEHVKRTSIYTWMLAKRLGEKGAYREQITQTFLKNIREAAPLHDIGKITIPDSVLSKQGRLTDEEYEKIKSHARAGADMLQKNMSKLVSADFLQDACDIAHYHHEKWNGKGYPEGLSGADIPLPARMLTVADVFDALVSKRQYKEGMGIDEAFAIMEREKGESFEPLILDTFFEMREDIEKVLAGKWHF